MQCFRLYKYRSIPGKRPCSAFQGVNVTASIQTYGNYIPGKCPCWPKSRVVFKRPWVLTCDTTVNFKKVKITSLYILLLCVLCRVKEIIGYSVDEIIAGNGNIGADLLHPAYSNILAPMKNYCESLLSLKFCTFGTYFLKLMWWYRNRLLWWREVYVGGWGDGRGMEREGKGGRGDL